MLLPWDWPVSLRCPLGLPLALHVVLLPLLLVFHCSPAATAALVIEAALVVLVVAA